MLKPKVDKSWFRTGNIYVQRDGSGGEWVCEAALIRIKSRHRQCTCTNCLEIKRIKNFVTQAFISYIYIYIYVNECLRCEMNTCVTKKTCRNQHHPSHTFTFWLSVPSTTFTIVRSSAHVIVKALPWRLDSKTRSCEQKWCENIPCAAWE